MKHSYLPVVPSKRFALVTTFFICLFLVCVFASYLTTRFLITPGQSGPGAEEHTHQWLHQELDLTKTEAAAIDAFEAEYRQQRQELREEFKRKITVLRNLLLANNRFTPEVEHAIHDIHQTHGQLQELSIRHYFQMLEVLPSEKKDTLRKIAGDALSVPE